MESATHFATHIYNVSTLFGRALSFLLDDVPYSILCRTCVRDSSEKPTARHERGLVADSPTRRGTPKGKSF